MKIGLLTIATNKYTDFVNRLYDSADKYFCAEHEVTYFLFTNKTDFVPQTKRNYKILHIDHEPWPMITLKRYHSFCCYEQELSEMKLVYYCDADMLFVDKVGNEIIGEKVVTTHPGFYNKPRKHFTYDNNPNSKAYIPPHMGKKYYAGGFNGGKTEEFLKMSRHIMNNVDEDLRQGIIARWHDESHLNHYYNIVARPSLELTPSYCYPENSNIPFPKKLLALDKNHKEYQI
jgi:histo-blood group ABO system transferase